MRWCKTKSDLRGQDKKCEARPGLFSCSHFRLPHPQPMSTKLSAQRLSMFGPAGISPRKQEPGQT
eukprot:1150379-Pelagomonas_calceolata.AAC.10